MTVLNITNLVAVRNQHGHTMQMSKELLETMYSAQHYAREVNMNMTGLAELLQSVQDVIFTIEFKRQPTEQSAFDIIQNAGNNWFKDAKKMSAMAKSVVEGSDCVLTCHMVEVENNLGRSLVIDLKADSQANRFRQIDHRTIESIIFKNVKYVLKKGGKSFSDIDTHIPKDEPKWDASKLKVGDMFSGTSYYQTVSDIGGQIFCYEKNFNDRGVMIDKNVMRDEMENACLWGSEERLSMTDLATILTFADNMCFQVCFTCKASENSVLEQLKAIKAKPKDAKALKSLARNCLIGNEQTLFCRLSKSEGKLGRSLVIDLATNGYKQIDHRTIQWIVINNVKYFLKK